MLRDIEIRNAQIRFWCWIGKTGLLAMILTVIFVSEPALAKGGRPKHSGFLPPQKAMQPKKPKMPMRPKPPLKNKMPMKPK
ncbi:MAG: hypothetical protein EBQ92_01970 [Proteobacteria bacterium]|nr:hypothetical protein [Pseudomonadota bacterium]